MSDQQEILKQILLKLNNFEENVGLKFGVMESRFDLLDKKVENCEKVLQQVNEKCGFLFEVAAADEMRRVNGESFARRFIAQDFRGLTRLALPKDETKDPLEYDDIFDKSTNILRTKIMVSTLF